jgi:hypothetical protein
VQVNIVETAGLQARTDLIHAGQAPGRHVRPFARGDGVDQGVFEAADHRAGAGFVAAGQDRQQRTVFDGRRIRQVHARAHPRNEHAVAPFDLEHRQYRYLAASRPS